MQAAGAAPAAARTRGLLPEQALPGGEVGALEQRVLQDALHAAQRLQGGGGGRHCGCGVGGGERGAAAALAGAGRGRGTSRREMPSPATTPAAAGSTQNGLHTRLDDVGAVVVEVPQLAWPGQRFGRADWVGEPVHALLKIKFLPRSTPCSAQAAARRLTVVALVRPPEGVDAGLLELLELLADAPALVVGQRVAVLLEQRVDARDAAVPAVLQVLQRQAPVLRLGGGGWWGVLGLQGVVAMWLGQLCGSALEAQGRAVCGKLSANPARQPRPRRRPLRTCASASWRLSAYSAHTRWLSMNSLSQGWM